MNRCSFKIHFWLHSFKTEISGALKGKIASVAFGQLPVFGPGDPQLHPVSAFELKGNIVTGIRAGMHDAVARIVRMARHIFPLGSYDGADGQAGTLIISVPLGNAADNGENDHPDGQNKHNAEQRPEPAESAIPEERTDRDPLLCGLSRILYSGKCIFCSACRHVCRQEA